MANSAWANRSKTSNKSSFEDDSQLPYKKAVLESTENKLKAKKQKTEHEKKYKKDELPFGDVNNSKILQGKNSDNDIYGDVQSHETLKCKGKKKKKINNKSDSIGSLNNEILHNANNILDEKEISQNIQVSAKVGKKKLLKGKKENFIYEGEVKYKLLKNGVKKPWLDLFFEENDVMTKYQNCFVKHEAVPELEKFKKKLEEQNISQKQIKNRMKRRVYSAYNQLNLELMKEKIKQQKGSEILPLSKNLRKNLRRRLNVDSILNTGTSADFNQIEESNFNHKKKIEIKLNYEESKLMTQFYGTWILRENLREMQILCYKNKERIIRERRDENTHSELTPNEELKLTNQMKKRFRKENYLLRMKLTKSKNRVKQKPSSFSSKKKKPGRLLGITFQENEDVVRYDGFYIKKEGSQRLHKLKEQMIANGSSEEEIRKGLKYERRKEERILKNEKKLFCYICMHVGHLASTCTKNEPSNANLVEINPTKRRNDTSHNEEFRDLNMNLPQTNEADLIDAYKTQKPRIIKFSD